MVNENYKKFCDELESAVKSYPTLSVKEKNGLRYLKGILDIPNDVATIVGSYFVEIHYSDGFPFRFPILLEVGGDIPNEANWHKYPNGKCCLTVEPDEILKCKHGITLFEFIQKYCLSFLANHVHRKHYKSYLNGDYSHSVNGLKEFYTEFFKSEVFSFWLKCIECALHTGVPLGRNDPCFCNMNKKFKHCHLKILNSLKEIGFKQLYKDMSVICPSEAIKMLTIKPKKQ